ncbi:MULTISPECIES: hypothetical protein [Catenuloplanes]|uniref:Uncharacterized protein n=1 Tax=Catenuloplanes niger TaxID=587534 RepID=A0AAE3ZSS9_9ACTN|nr:hypothetical protein [Catenuloplanes niger]MDR7324347.1 hypothetical protein [Catenuloplanes niger]
MTDLEALRRELREPLGAAAGSLDLGVIVAKGRRLRRRRRLTVAGAVAAVLAVGAAVPVLYRSPAPPPTVVAATPAADVMIRTGAADGRAFTLEPAGAGRLRLRTGWAMGASFVVQDEAVSDRAPGFHVFTVPGETGAVFGYHVGRADRISGRVDGELHDARLWPWSGDPSIVVFWFPAAPVGDPVVRDLSAAS